MRPDPFAPPPRQLDPDQLAMRSILTGLAALFNGKATIIIDEEPEGRRLVRIVPDAQ